MNYCDSVLANILLTGSDDQILIMWLLVYELTVNNRIELVHDWV